MQETGCGHADCYHILSYENKEDGDIRCMRCGKVLGKTKELTDKRKREIDRQNAILQKPTYPRPKAGPYDI